MPEIPESEAKELTDTIDNLGDALIEFAEDMETVPQKDQVEFGTGIQVELVRYRVEKAIKGTLIALNPYKLKHMTILERIIHGGYVIPVFWFWAVWGHLSLPYIVYTGYRSYYGRWESIKRGIRMLMGYPKMFITANWK